jgi:site-specific recombinase XerD
MYQDYSMTIGELLTLFTEHLTANGRSPETINTYRRRLDQFFANGQAGPDTPLATITPELLDQWAAAIHTSSLAQATRLGYIQNLKTLLTFAYRRGYMERNVGDELERPHLDHNAAASGRVMKAADLKLLVNHLTQTANIRDLAIISFMADTGARRGEVSTLRIPDLLPDQLDAYVTGKTGRQLVDYTATTRDIINLWLEQRPAVWHNFVFTSSGSPTSSPGDPICPGAINQIMRRLARAAGCSGPTNPHAIRHLVGQTFSDHVNLELVRQKLRHSNIHTTAAFYAHQDRERLKAATVLYSPIAIASIGETS